MTTWLYAIYWILWQNHFKTFLVSRVHFCVRPVTLNAHKRWKSATCLFNIYSYCSVNKDNNLNKSILQRFTLPWGLHTTKYVQVFLNETISLLLTTHILYVSRKHNHYKFEEINRKIMVYKKLLYTLLIHTVLCLLLEVSQSKQYKPMT